MEKKKLDTQYGEELDALYKMAVKKKEVLNAMCILDKRRNLDLYTGSKDYGKEDEVDTAV